MSTHPTPLTGRKVLVTGAASGIGRAVAVRCGSMGAEVVAVDQDKAGLGMLEREIGCRTAVADLADRDLIPQLVSDASTTMHGLDGLVCCAGVQAGATFEETSAAAWDRTLAVNLASPYFLIQAALPHLRRSASASVVTVASGVALRPDIPGVSAYAGSKAGLIGVTKALAAELAPEVRLNVVCPGVTRTPMTRDVLDAPGGSRPAFLDRYALKRAAEPDEIAAGIVFLLGSDASYVTGAVLAVDGGRTFH